MKRGMRSVPVPRPGDTVVPARATVDRQEAAIAVAERAYAAGVIEVDQLERYVDDILRDRQVSFATPTGLAIRRAQLAGAAYELVGGTDCIVTRRQVIGVRLR